MIARDAEVDALYRQVEDRVTDLHGPAGAGRLRPAYRSSPPCTSPPTWSGWATSPTTWRRPRCAGTRRRRCPRSCGRSSPQMADVADRMAAKIADVLAKLDAVGAAELERDDDAMDDAAQGALPGACSAADWPYGVETAIDGALLGRFYERYADHAVNAGHHVVYLVTGEQDPEPAAGRPRRLTAQRPWLATAAAASFAASGSR